MISYRTSGLLIVAIMSAYWAYTIIDSLIREFSKNITYIDLGAIFILGLISGVTLGLALVFRRG
jgi:hypothetical protein